MDSVTDMDSSDELLHVSLLESENDWLSVGESLMECDSEVSRVAVPMDCEVESVNDFTLEVVMDCVRDADWERLLLRE